jgi:predicted HTH transcriptional regulator
VGRTITVADSYTAEEFARLISRETDRLELKTGAGAKPLQEAMVAFSNTDGGVIFLGVDDRRQVQGRQLDHGTDDRIHEAAVGAHGIGRYRIREIEVDGRPVVAVQVWLDRLEARAALQRLRDTGFLVQQGQRGGTSYVLARTVGHGAVQRLSDEEIARAVLEQAARGPIRNEDVRRLTGLDRLEVSTLLARLVDRGQLVRRGERRGTEYVLGGGGERS